MLIGRPGLFPRGAIKVPVGSAASHPREKLRFCRKPCNHDLPTCSPSSATAVNTTAATANGGAPERNGGLREASRAFLGGGWGHAAQKFLQTNATRLHPGGRQTNAGIAKLQPATRKQCCGGIEIPAFPPMGVKRRKHRPQPAQRSALSIARVPLQCELQISPPAAKPSLPHRSDQRRLPRGIPSRSRADTCSDKQRQTPQTTPVRSAIVLGPAWV